MKPQNAEVLQLEKRNNIQFGLMANEDNDGVLALIRSMPVQGEFETVFTKEPDYMKAMLNTADSVQPVIGKYNDKIKVLGTRSVKKAYINGQVDNLGYLSDLKISPEVKKMRALSEGFSFMKTLMTDGRANLHIATIIDDNRAGKAVLTWKSKSSEVADFHDFGLLHTYFILPVFPKIFRSKYKIIRAKEEILDDIVEFLNEEGKKKQFFPVYTKEYFLNLPNFRCEDFYVALSDKKIIGVMAKWEQTPFKQVVIKRYNGKWKYIKCLTGKLLPKESEPIKQFYLSFIAVKNHHSDIFEALFNTIYNDNRDYKYFSVILHEKDNLNLSMKKYLSIKYDSRLYIVGGGYSTLNDEIPYLELAGL